MREVRLDDPFTEKTLGTRRNCLKWIGAELRILGSGMCDL